MLLVEAIILSVLAASTPLLLAAAGELVVERAGVLNLGVEGMMIMGAACGFAGAYFTGSTLIGALCGILAGAGMSAIFAALTLAFGGSLVYDVRRSGRDPIECSDDTPRGAAGPPGSRHETARAHRPP